MIKVKRRALQRRYLPSQQTADTDLIIHPSLVYSRVFFITKKIQKTS